MRHGSLPRKVWVISALAMILIAGHTAVLFHVLSRMASGVLLGMVLLVLLKHVGVLGATYGFLKRRSRRRVRECSDKAHTRSSSRKIPP
jgi:hypothetical protein